MCWITFFNNNLYKNEVRKVITREINETQQIFEYKNVNIRESDKCRGIYKPMIIKMTRMINISYSKIN